MIKKVLQIISGVILVILVLGVAHVLYYTRDRHPGYSLDLTLPQGLHEPTQGIQVGLAKAVITPSLPDTWVDVDDNAQYEPDKGDTFVDGNRNGRFDAIWLAGFSNKRAANGVHDDLWARAMVWDDGTVAVAMVSLDAIGLFHDDVITIRERVAKECPDIDHVIVTATHCHEVPDLMGMWGQSEFKTGVSKPYLKYVQDQTVKAIGDAFDNRQPAILKIAKSDPVERDLIEDGRPPEVYDDQIRMMKVEQADTGEHLGLLLNYGCHPETLGSKNLLVTADYAHYWLSGIEQGIVYGGDKKRDGVGGMAIYAQGAVGGLMTAMGCSTHDPWLDTTFAPQDRTFDKARAQGYRLANLVLDHIEQGDWQTIDEPAIRLRAKTFQFKLQNRMFTLGGIAGVFDRGFKRLKYVRSEVNVLTIGPAWFITLPGEVNPEIVNGGIQTPEGRDFEIQAVEVPPVRDLMKGDINFAVGLANDEVGYIMPKTHWDAKPPFTYGKKKAMYGEINSLGPDAGPVFYQQIKSLIEDL
ncbi:MAG: neutral/alkaline non-lysosomal ceramidase N-terminal domain-containing protein [Phycisphaerae bacterium]|nr:neutral/alkaline non-lysosomal ceramidase N-terminal domain-containing protein [Phycisphaerae bacterium]